MSSDYGIIQFNKTSQLSRTFLPGDGLPHYEFNRISHFQSKSGQLYFGYQNGVTTFHPRRRLLETGKHLTVAEVAYAVG